MHALPTSKSRASHRLLIAVFSLVTTVATIVWVLRWIGLPGRRGDALFRWHPIIMSVGALLLLPMGVLSWYVEQNESDNDDPYSINNNRHADEEAQTMHRRRGCVKLQHVVLVVSGFILMSIGACVAYASHMQQNLANLYSLHSWVGIAALVAINMNVIMGVIAAVVQCARASLSITVHRVIGVVAVALSSAAAVLGFAELQTFLVRGKGPWTAAALLAGPLAIMAAAVGLGTIYAIVVPHLALENNHTNNDSDCDKGGGPLLNNGGNEKTDEVFGDGLCDMVAQKDMPEIVNVDTDTRELSSNSDTSG